MKINFKKIIKKPKCTNMLVIINFTEFKYLVIHNAMF